jgi:hypothetical protein
MVSPVTADVSVDTQAIEKGETRYSRRRALTGIGRLHPDGTLAREYPLSPRRLALVHAWTAPGVEGYIVAAKGAPEAIAALGRYNAAQTQALLAQVGVLADQGLRVLGVARARGEGTVPAAPEDIPFTFVGLVGLADPVRPDVAAAIAECTGAIGSRVQSKGAIGYALSDVIDDSVFEDLVPLVCDHRHGHARQRIVTEFGMLHDPRAVAGNHWP